MTDTNGLYGSPYYSDTGKIALQLTIYTQAGCRLQAMSISCLQGTAKLRRLLGAARPTQHSTARSPYSTLLPVRLCPILTDFSRSSVQTDLCVPEEVWYLNLFDIDTQQYICIEIANMKPT